MRPASSRRKPSSSAISARWSWTPEGEHIEAITVCAKERGWVEEGTFMKNIMQIYVERGSGVPFVVRRENWSADYGLVVVRVELKDTGRGLYGKAYGFGLPPLNGKRADSRFGTPAKLKEISCAGCYQWEEVLDLPDEWVVSLRIAES
jgi:hypothetical protein